ncbi:hypothetical protein [Zunongwangia pacifica]|uniref:Lipoprotein n=1 Tax=Zunongwangia pacifica TaxID=2911062 RepID=A0A9X1ZWQ1_9FLAO|nr:hypothetical protein [Zunongwangia pacifica]MCL6220600.1 hypothetical protein [Zunongwangia pacifica]
MKTKGLLILIMIVFTACNMYRRVVKNDIKIANGYYAIGSIIEGDDNKSYPIYDEKIKLSWRENKLGQREINRVNRSLNQNEKLEIIDSLDIFPKALVVEIADYPSVISNLKQPNNRKELSLLKNDPSLRLVYSLNIFFKEKEASQIKDASVLYLTNPSKGIYSIEAIQRDGVKNRIYFQDGIIIEKATKGFCWQLNYRNQPELIDISNRCPKGTEKDSQDLEVIDKIDGAW